MPSLDLCVCNNCGCYREEHYLRDGSWNQSLGCGEYQGRNATDKELKEREGALGKYQQWLVSRRATVAAAAATPWRA